jgi:hypothetical protein
MFKKLFRKLVQNFVYKLFANTKSYAQKSIFFNFSKNAGKLSTFCGLVLRLVLHKLFGRFLSYFVGFCTLSTPFINTTTYKLN